MSFGSPHFGRFQQTRIRHKIQGFCLEETCTEVEPVQKTVKSDPEYVLFLNAKPTDPLTEIAYVLFLVRE